MKYGLGFQPDPDGHVRASFSDHPAAAIDSTPLDVDLRPYAPRVKDQGAGEHATNACMGHGTSGVISMTFRAKGKPLPWEPSETGIYTVGRCVERRPDANGVLPDLKDDGASPSQVVRGVNEYGIRPSKAPTPDGRNSDADPAWINDVPSLDELEQDAHHLVVGDHQIFHGQRVADTRKALASLVGVGIAFQVDAACDAYDGSTPLPAPDPKTSRGGHWVYCVGYRTLSNGKTVFRLRNSWGSAWGIDGDFEVTEGFMEAALVVIAFDVQEVAS